MKALVIAAHPDDAEIGMGGTIVSLTERGHEVIIVDLTDGEPTPYGSPSIREKESRRASEILNITKRINLGMTNRELFDSVEARKAVAEVIREEKPEILFSHYFEDTHPDHLEASKMVDAARFYSKFVKTDMKGAPHTPRKVLYYFSTHIKPKFTPHFIFDISSTFEKKIKALMCYESQFYSNPANRNIKEMLEATNRFWGVQAGTEYGEPFVCRENLRLVDTDSLFTL